MTDICFVATDAISFNVLYRGQLEFLKRRGHSLTLICGGSEAETQRLRDRRVGEVVRVDLVRPPRPAADLKALAQLIWHFKQKRHETVIVTTPKAILLGAIAAWVTGQPRRVVFFQGRVYENFSGLARVFYRALDRLAAWCAHEVLFVSTSLMDEYRREAAVFTQKGRVLGAGSGNGVCGTKFDPLAHAATDVGRLRASLGLLPTEFVALAVGRLCVDKGLAELDALAARAANEDSRVRIVVVGPVEHGAQPLFNQLMSRGNVVHVGFTQDVTPYFALADVHLFLSHREGFGNVAIEAAAMGVPTIAFDVVGVRDSVSNELSGIRVPFGDISAVWRELARMLLDPDETARKYAGARQWVLENFAQDRAWELYASFYAR
jgi:glycosyltransferase involved in cell wall biosynthesis